jgi:hypothetical protein
MGLNVADAFVVPRTDSLLRSADTSRFHQTRSKFPFMLHATEDKDQEELETQELQAELDKFMLHATEDKDQEELETQELQAELDKLVAEPPMFSSFNSDNFDEKALPIPMFTASIIALGSLFCTFYLFNIGINGFPEGPIN